MNIPNDLNIRAYRSHLVHIASEEGVSLCGRDLSTGFKIFPLRMVKSFRRCKKCAALYASSTINNP